MNESSGNVTIKELVREGVLDRPMDGNHGEIHPKGDDFVASGVPFITAADIKEGRVDISGCAFISETQARSLRKGFAKLGDVLLTHKATMGRTAIVEEVPEGLDWIVLTPQVTYYRVLQSDVLDPRYLKYYFDSPEFQTLLAAWSGGGSTRSYLGITKQLDLPILLLPIDTQRAIAEVLGSLDQKIEQNRRTRRALEGLARAIFKAWFVDFEPVKAKAAGADRFPGMPPAAFAVLPTRLTDSPLGPLPLGWRVRPLDGVVTLTMGQSPKSKFYNKDGRGLPFHQGVTDYGFRYPTHRIFCTVEKRLAAAGDVLLSVRAPVGRINIADQPLILGRGLAGLRHKHDQQSFLLYQMLHIFAEEDAIGDGTIYRAVNKGFLSAMPLLDPPAELRDAFEASTRPIDDLILANEKESSKLFALRDYLLPRLLSGRVRVRDNERAGGAT